MKDVNLSLRQAYYSILNGNVSVQYTSGSTIPVPTYNMFVPAGFPSFYIVIQSITGIGVETKDSQDREISIQFLISTRLEKNSGWECDMVADQIFQLCYPNREAVVPGCASMEMVSDITLNDIDPSTRFQIVERNLIFKHTIVN